MEGIVNKSNENVLFNDVCNIIDQTRNRIATYINTEVCLTNWYVGKRIKEDVLYNQRAEYGKQILKNLSKRLIAHYGGGWGFEKLKHCVRSAYLISSSEKRYAATFIAIEQASPILWIKYHIKNNDIFEKEYSYTKKMYY